MRNPFAERLARHAADPAAPPALVLPDAEVSYAELHRRVEHAAAWLRAEGCAAGDIVGITIADDVPHLVVALALLGLGLPLVALPTYQPGPARRKLAAALGVTRVVALDRVHALDGVALSLATPSFLAQPGPTPLQESLSADPDATAMFVASSGSTGEPKLIALGARMLRMRHEQRAFPARERLLTWTTLEDVFGMSPRLDIAWSGATSVFRPPADAVPTAALGAYCASKRVSRFGLGVLNATTLVREAGATLPAGLRVVASGARVPMRLREAYRALGRAHLQVEYGAREVGLISGTTVGEPDPDVESVGAVGPHAEVEVVDAEGRAVAPGDTGEVRVRTTSMIHGYHQDAAASARLFRDGWFHTGDVGAFAPGGSLLLRGRVDDVMNLRGIKVYPSEIEHVLERDPAVRTAAAFALRSELYGEIPVAAVEWQGEARPDPAALLSLARAELGVRAPRRVVVVDELPRLGNGKVARRDLVALVERAR